MDETPDDDLSWRPYLVAATITLVLAAIVLLAMGRTMWGAADGPGLWSGDIYSKLNSQRLTDPYTFSHVSHGLVFFGLLWLLVREYLSVGGRLVATVILESSWEVLENTPMVIERFREATMAQGYYGDSVLNSMGDILACVVGFTLAMKLPNKWIIPVFLLLEALLVFWIRDSMLLNILMLVYPVPGIREWQAAG